VSDFNFRVVSLVSAQGTRTVRLVAEHGQDCIGGTGETQADAAMWLLHQAWLMADKIEENLVGWGLLTQEQADYAHARFEQIRDRKVREKAETP